MIKDCLRVFVIDIAIIAIFMPPLRYDDIDATPPLIFAITLRDCCHYAIIAAAMMPPYYATGAAIS